MASGVGRASPSIRQNGLGLSVAEGCLAMVPSTFTTGVFLTGFALVLGADTWALGVIAAICAAAQAGQLAAPVLLERGCDGKALTVWAASLGRYLWLPIAALPFLPLDPALRLGLFFVLLTLSTALSQMAGTTWTDWMTDMVPADIRGRYFGLRSGAAAMIGLALTAGGTWWLDHVGNAPGAKAEAMAMLLSLAAFGAIASQLALMGQPGPPPRTCARRPAFTALAAPVRDRRFRGFALRYWSWTFVVGMTAPFAIAYALTDLGYSYTLVGLHTTVFVALSVASQPYWGRIIDRLGAQAALRLAIVPILLHPLYWFAMTPAQTWPIWFDAVSSGLFWPGVQLASMALLMEAAPRDDRAGYLAVFSTGNGLAASLAALAGAAIIGALASLGLPAGLGGYGGLLLLSVVARAVAIAALWRLPAIARPTVTIETRVAVSGPEPLPASADGTARPATAP